MDNDKAPLITSMEDFTPEMMTEMHDGKGDDEEYE